MGFFATLVGRGSVGEMARGDATPADVQQGLPARFHVVAEHLAAGRDATVACAVVGREMARDGADLGEALHRLRSTYALVEGTEPDFRSTQALCLAWGEETLAYLHQLSCEDPLTGLASIAHLRARLSEVYRGCEQRGESANLTRALVVVDLPLLANRARATDHREESFNAALWMVRLVETVRMVFPGEESIGQLTGSRLAVLAHRNAALGRRVALLRGLVEDFDGYAKDARVWIEGLPATNDGAAWLLDEVSRN